jgi:8-oxo-dGTP pyrophosphatase MutT (NUDIX family)
MTASTVAIEPAPARVTVRYAGKRFVAPPQLRRDIERHWATRRRSGASFTRGPIFHVTSLSRKIDELSFETELSDYAHYVYTIDGGDGACRVLYTAALLRTRDGMYLIGEMAPHTVTPGRLQCAGGGLDLADFRDGIADLASSIRSEIHEETGITRGQIERLKPAYVKSGGEHGFFAVIFSVDLTLAQAEAIEQFERQDGITAPEFSAVVAVPAQSQAVRRFLADDPRPRVDYLAPLLMFDVQRR